MKRFKKILLWLMLVIIAGLIAFFAWYFLTGYGTRDPYSVVPEDAVFVIETEDLTEGWSQISKSAMWTSLKTNEYFADVNESASILDSLIKNNSTLSSMMGNRRLIVSAHMISPTDYDFLFVVDMQRGSKISFIKDYINSIIKQFGYSLKNRSFEGTELTELTDAETGEIIYLYFADNLLVASYNQGIIEKSIKEMDEEKPGLRDVTEFHDVNNKIGENLFSVKVNYKMLEKFLMCYMSEPGENAKELSKSLFWSSLAMKLENERLSLKGWTNVNDSTSSYLKAMLDVTPADMGAFEVIPDEAAMYFSLTFKDFMKFYENLQKEFARENDDYEGYSKRIEKVEKYLKISLKDDFFGWIGNEIAMGMLKPSGMTDSKEVVVAVHARDINDAKEGMDHLMRQIKRRTPAKFETVTHQEYEINFLNIKGFFRLFLGKLFDKIDKPYFTYIDDYVVFSNTPEMLMGVIDNYIKGATLSRNMKFMRFVEDFNKAANVSIFLQMPKMYTYLWYYADADTKKSIRKNREHIASFARVGFQMNATGRMYDTRLLADFEAPEGNLDDLEKVASAENDLMNKEIESLSFKPALSAEQLSQDGEFKTKYTSGNLQYEWNVKDGKLDGLCRTYYESGKIKSAVNYKDGKAEGLATFYYENGEKRAEAKLEEEKIVDEYKEFYDNGARKAVIPYKDGLAHGSAQFFFPSGNLKLEGKYKEGQREKKWKYYTEDGDMLRKKKFKDDKEKGTE